MAFAYQGADQFKIFAGDPLLIIYGDEHSIVLLRFRRLRRDQGGRRDYSSAVIALLTMSWASDRILARWSSLAKLSA